MSARPAQVTDTHLRRKAVVYIRQSSIEQVRENSGSTAVQRDLPKLLESWGWRPDQIETVDDDLGVTGAAAGLRDGFNRVVAEMKAGRVGIVAVVDASRLGRNFLDLARFAEAAEQQNVLLAQNGQVSDFADPNSEFVNLITGLNAVRENRARSLMARRARRKKAEAGIASTAPPIGYVKTAPGVWDKDPEPQVREAIQLVFDKFAELGTVGRVVRALRKSGAGLPRRRRYGQKDWAPATRPAVYKTLRNPAYAGTYVYGKTAVDESLGLDSKGHKKTKRQPETEHVYLRDHHPAYVPFDRWVEIQKRLTANRSERVAPAGRGEALVQGLLRCATHDKTMKTYYYGRQRAESGDVIRKPSYVCQPFMEDAGDTTHCVTTHARWVDQRVEAAILSTLATPSVEAIRLAAREALREHDGLVRARDDELRRARQGAAEAERAYDQAPSSQPYFKERMSQRLDEALARLKAVEESHRRNPLVPPLTLDDSELAELQALCADLPRLWRHPGVTAEHRKAVVRRVVVAVHVTPTPELLHTEIEWVGGARTQLQISRHRHIARLLRGVYKEGLTDREIVARLRHQGVLQHHGKHVAQPYDTHAVADSSAVRSSSARSTSRRTRSSGSGGVRVSTRTRSPTS